MWMVDHPIITTLLVLVATMHLITTQLVALLVLTTLHIITQWVTLVAVRLMKTALHITLYVISSNSSDINI